MRQYKSVERFAKKRPNPLGGPMRPGWEQKGGLRGRKPTDMEKSAPLPSPMGAPVLGGGRPEWAPQLTSATLPVHPRSKAVPYYRGKTRRHPGVPEHAQPRPQNSGKYWA